MAAAVAAARLCAAATFLRARAAAGSCAGGGRQRAAASEWGCPTVTVAAAAGAGCCGALPLCQGGLMCWNTNRQALLNWRGVSGSTGACLPRLLHANNRMVASPQHTTPTDSTPHSRKAGVGTGVGAAARCHHWQPHSAEHPAGAAAAAGRRLVAAPQCNAAGCCPSTRRSIHGALNSSR